MRAINLLGSEVTLTTNSGNTITNALLVRCVVASGTGVVYRSSNTPALIGSCTVISTEPTYIFKDSTDTLTASGTVLATPITFMY
jgi:hypothetical protein